MCLHVFITVIFGGYLVTFARRAVGSSCRKPIKPQITRSHARDAVLVWVDAGGIGGTYGHCAGHLGAVWGCVVPCRHSTVSPLRNEHHGCRRTLYVKRASAVVCASFIRVWTDSCVGTQRPVRMHAPRCVCMFMYILVPNEQNTQQCSLLSRNSTAPHVHGAERVQNLTIFCGQLVVHLFLPLWVFQPPPFFPVHVPVIGGLPSFAAFIAPGAPVMVLHGLHGYLQAFVFGGYSRTQCLIHYCLIHPNYPQFTPLLLASMLIHEH